MIKNGIKRLVTTSFALIMATGMVAQNSAFSSLIAPEVNAAEKSDFGNIEYYTDENDNDIRTGFKSIEYKGKTYFDIADNEQKTVKDDNGKEYKVPITIDHAQLEKLIYKKDENNDLKKEIQRKWAKIAVGMMQDLNTDYTCNGKDFVDNFVNGDSSDDDDEIDLARALGEVNNETVNQGHTRDDCIRGTGLFEINSLNDARKRMGQEIYHINDEKISYGEFMKEGPGKGKDSALPDLKKDDSTLGFATIVTSLNQRGGTYGYDYASFGIAFYDFDIAPFCDSEELEHITSFESVKNEDSLIEAATSNHAPAFHYESSTGVEDQSDGVHVYYENDSADATSKGLTQGTSTSKSWSNSFEESSSFAVNEKFGISLGGKGKPGGWFLKLDKEISFNFSSSQTFSHSESSTVSNSTSTDLTGSVNVTVPAHTAVEQKAFRDNKKLSYTYKCPVALTYKVVIFGMNGYFYSDGAATNYMNTAGYHHACFSMKVGEGNETYGKTAEDNLYYRLNHETYDSSDDQFAGTTSCWTDRDTNEKKSINWTKVKTKVPEINNYAKSVPMCGMGGTIEFNTNVLNYVIGDFSPLYDLDEVKLADVNYSQQEMSTDTELPLYNLGVNGFDDGNVPYYGFNANDGHWVLCKADGTRMTPQEIEGVKSIAEIRLSPNGYQYLKGIGEGTVYLKWVLKDGKSLSSIKGVGPVTSENFDTRIPCGQNGKNKTFITVQVNESPSYTVKSMEINRKEEIDKNSTGFLNGFLDVVTTDTQGIRRNAPFYWDASWDSDYSVTSDGKVTITKPTDELEVFANSRFDDNVYKKMVLKAARVKLSEGASFLDRDGNKTTNDIYIVGDGVRVKSDKDDFVAFKLEYPNGDEEMIYDKEAFFVMPDIDADQTLKVTEITADMIRNWTFALPENEAENMWIGEGQPSVTADLKNWIGQGDYTDEEWEHFDPARIVFTVADAEGNPTDDASVDEGTLTVSAPGTYQLTASKDSTVSTLELTVREVKKDDQPVDPVDPVLDLSTITDVDLNEEGKVEITFEGPEDREGSIIQLSTNEQFIPEEEDVEGNVTLQGEIREQKVEGQGTKAVIEDLDDNTQWFVRVFAYGKKEGKDVYGEPSTPLNIQGTLQDKAIEDVKKAIKDIPAELDDSEATKTLVDDAKEAFDALPEEAQKKLSEDQTVSTKLDAATKAMDAIASIKALPDPAAESDTDAVQKARAAYDAYETMSEEAKAAASIKQDLLDTLKANLEKAEEEYAQSVADKAKELISKLPDLAELKDKEAVEAAKAALAKYEALSEELQKSVKDFSADELKAKLTKADGQVKAAEEAAKKASDGGKKDTPPAAAPVVKVASIRLIGLSRKIAAGKKLKLTATVLPADAANKKLKWTSSNKKLATVTQTGTVKLKKKAAGKTVKIIASATDGSGKKAVWKIKGMKGIVKKITVKGAKKTLKAGKTMKLKAVVKATKGANKKLKWTSSNTEYATVTSTGKVKALNAGIGKTVTIKVMATDGSGRKVSKKIKITK